MSVLLRARLRHLESWFWLLGVTASLATAVFLSVATRNTRGSDYAIAEAHEIEDLAVAIAAAHDRGGSGFAAAAIDARINLVEMRTEAEEILGSRGAEQGDALIRDLDQLIDAAQRAAGPETDAAIDAAPLAYDRDLLALISCCSPRTWSR